MISLFTFISNIYLSGFCVRVCVCVCWGGGGRGVGGGGFFTFGIAIPKTYLHPIHINSPLSSPSHPPPLFPIPPQPKSFQTRLRHSQPLELKIGALDCWLRSRPHCGVLAGHLKDSTVRGRPASLMPPFLRLFDFGSGAVSEGRVLRVLRVL